MRITNVSLDYDLGIIKFETGNLTLHQIRVYPSSAQSVIKVLRKVYHWPDKIANIQFSQNEITFSNINDVLIAKI